MKLFDEIEVPKPKGKEPHRREDGTWDLKGVLEMDELLCDKIYDDKDMERQIAMGQLPGWAK